MSMPGYLGEYPDGPPAYGTYFAGQWTVDPVNGAIRICIASGSPGTWVAAGLLPANNLSDLDSRQSALNNLAGAVTSGQYLRGNGTNVLLAAIAAADLPAATTSAQGAVQLPYILAAAQSGGMTGLGYVGATGNPVNSLNPLAPGTHWASGAIYGQLLFCVPGATPNGYVTLAPWGGGALAGTYIALYNSSGTQLGITADLSSQATASRGIRVAVTGWTAMPSNGLIYMLYTNGTQASGAGPYVLEGQAYNSGYPNVSLPSDVIVMGFLDTGPTTMPSSLTFGSNGIPSGFADNNPLFFQAFLD